MSRPAPDLGWWVIRGKDLLAALHQVAGTDESGGDDPEVVFVELWANARAEQVE